MNVRPKKISKTERIVLDARIEETFLLFGPIKEKEWADGWEPHVIYSDGPDVQEHMIFRTKSHTSHEDHYTWIVTQYQPEDYFIEYTVFTSQRIWFISIKCWRGEDRRKTLADITYTYIGLSEVGNHLNEKALASMFWKDLKDWEEAINHYLTTGKKLDNHCNNEGCSTDHVLNNT